MASLPQRLNLTQMQQQWAAQLNPVLANLLVQGQLLTNQSLAAGNNAISHKLGRVPNGWMLSAPKAPAVIYEAAYQLNPTLTLTLISDSSVITDIWVY